MQAWLLHDVQKGPHSRSWYDLGLKFWVRQLETQPGCSPDFSDSPVVELKGKKFAGPAV